MTWTTSSARSAPPPLEGVGCIVDGGHPDLRRDLDAVLRVANETDVHVVASGGYYMARYLSTRDRDDERGSDRRRPGRRRRSGSAGRFRRDRPELEHRRDDP